MNKIILLFLLPVLGGCVVTARIPKPISLAEYAAQSGECIDGWNDIIAEWIDGGGRITSDLDGTRAYISRDGTRLSRILRGTWSIKRKYSSDFDRWEAFSDVPSRTAGLSGECTSFVWLQELIAGNEAMFASNAKTELKQRMGLSQDNDRGMALRILKELLFFPADAASK